MMKRVMDIIRVIDGARTSRLLSSSLTRLAFWNVVLLAAAVLVYELMNFDAHFSSTDSRPVSTGGKVYYALMCQTAVGCNDIVPKTDRGRFLTGVHVTLAWATVLTFMA